MEINDTSNFNGDESTSGNKRSYSAMMGDSARSKEQSWVLHEKRNY
jgi:hypothetical protein